MRSTYAQCAAHLRSPFGRLTDLSEVERWSDRAHHFQGGFMQRRFSSATALIVLTISLFGAGAWLSLSGKASATRASLLRPTGEPQLVSVQQLPEATGEGEMCEWVPASSQETLRASLQ